MLIDYHDLSDKDFERLTVAICSEILGTGIVPYSTGPDGGRDARFEGTAADLPNSAAPHSGKFIVQAKHTENPIAKYSDSDFSGDGKGSTLTKELPAIKALTDGGHLDCYLLFSNRRMSGLTEEPIRARVSKETGAKIVELFGIERIDHLLAKHPKALQTFGAKPLQMPIFVRPDDLAEVILAISKNNNTFEDAFQPEELHRISFKQKNSKNGLTNDLADYIIKKHMPHFQTLSRFLAKPGNEAILERYTFACDDFEEQIAAHRSQFDTFDAVLLRIMRLLFDRDSDLSKRRRETRLVIYYMYWNCDIGSEFDNDATAKQAL